MPDDEPVSVRSRESTAETVKRLMPDLKAKLAQLVAIPSISSPGFPEPHQPLVDAYELVVGLLRDAGVERLDTLSLPGTAPVVVGSIPPPAGAPTVLLYGHYDVVPAGEESEWDSPPFVPIERDGAMFGRGTADSKSNVMVHVGALRAYGGRPPVGIKLVIEGQEEVGSALNAYPPTDPDLFRADAMLIADMGSLRPGVPTLTVALRGTAMLTIEVTTLAGLGASRSSSSRSSACRSSSGRSRSSCCSASVFCRPGPRARSAPISANTQRRSSSSTRSPSAPTRS